MILPAWPSLQLHRCTTYRFVTEATFRLAFTCCGVLFGGYPERLMAGCAANQRGSESWPARSAPHLLGNKVILILKPGFASSSQGAALLYRGSLHPTPDLIQPTLTILTLLA